MVRNLTVALIIVFLAGCQSLPQGGPLNSERPGPIVSVDARSGMGGDNGYGQEYWVSFDGLTTDQELVVRSAMELLGRDRLVVRGRRFTLDCTGVVLAAYWGAGFDLMPLFNAETGNGVKRLHDIGVTGGTLKDDQSALPEPGDIIIWDNTYDRDGDKKWGDPMTHNGIVVDVTPDGQVTYIHHNYAAGIVTARMHLGKVETHLDVDGRTEVNSPMRMRSDRYIRPSQWLSSHLFREYVEVLSLLEQS